MSDPKATPRIIRKKTGHFLEDFKPGQLFRHKGGKTITEGLFTTFTEFAMTTNPLSKNARYARAHGFEGQRVICFPARDVVVVRLGKMGPDDAPALNAHLAAIARCFPLR